jgi:hypothetical protein
VSRKMWPWMACPFRVLLKRSATPFVCGWATKAGAELQRLNPAFPASRRVCSVVSPARRLPALFLLQRGHVDGETVLHIRLQQALVGLVDPLDRDHLHIGDDAVLAAEVEHLLGLGDAADQRA